MIQGLTEEPIGYKAKVAIAYLAIIVAFTLAIVLFPSIAVWLPEAMAK